MGLKSLKGKLLFSVSAFVIGSGLLISLLTTHRYSGALLETMTAQGENLAQAIALEAADPILINDLLSLQVMLDYQIRSHSALAYLFIHRQGEILAHTFQKGVPVDLMIANHLSDEGRGRPKEVLSTGGDRYLDVAWPVFEGKAGVLRLGLSNAHYQKRVQHLWIQMLLLTSFILLIVVTGVTLFLRRVTNPLSELCRATERIDQGDLSVRVAVSGEDEVSRLAGSFNRMTSRLEDYTSRLESKAMELEQANRQALHFCHMIQQMGAMRSLLQIGSYLIRQFRETLQCTDRMLLLFSNTRRDGYFILSGEEVQFVREKGLVEDFYLLLEGHTKSGMVEGLRLPADIRGTRRFAFCPIRSAEEPFGALLIQCREECGYDAGALAPIELFLGQSVGVIGRAVLDEEEARDSKERFETSAGFGGMVGKDPKMQSIYMMIEDIAPTDTTVLIQGESGTGKEMVARAIHQMSCRKENPFMVIDCSAYPETLLESELFGHEKGAFTGATRQKAGRFEQADGGTVFLDEIGEISPSAQIKLLRVIQTQRFERLGGEKTLHVNIRILAATNKDLLKQVKAGRFREDLYYRLNVIPLQVPPLRERRNDIPLLAGSFLQRFAGEQRKTLDGFSPEAMRMLLNHPWPGNVRELENGVEHAAVLAKGARIEPSDLPSSIIESNRKGPDLVSSGFPSMAENEKDLLMGALEKCGWNKKEVAKRLGISRNTLYQKLKRYNLSRPSTH